MVVLLFSRCSPVLALMQCKNCKFSHSDSEVLLKHYRLHHGQGLPEKNWPCLYLDCVCSFKTSGALKLHLARFHTQAVSQINTTFKCELCAFRNTCESSFFSHLFGHLRSHETVSCPFKGCQYKTNKLRNFSTHKSRIHKTHTSRHFKNAVITKNGNTEARIDSVEDLAEASTSSQTGQAGNVEDCELDSVDGESLVRKLAALFLGMQTVLHVSKYTIQKIIEELRDVLYFSKVLALETVKELLVKHKIDIDPSIIQEISNAIFESNVILQSTSAKGNLSSDYRRNLFFKEHFSVIEPTEYRYDRTP